MESLKKKLVHSYASGKRPSEPNLDKVGEFTIVPPWVAEKNIMGVDFTKLDKGNEGSTALKLTALNSTHSVVSEIDVNAAPSWLIGDLGIVYDGYTKLNMSSPNLSVALSSKYLEWPMPEISLPAVFLKLCPISGDPAIIDAHKSTLGIPAARATAIVMYSLSPEIYGMYVEAVRVDPNASSRTIYFLVKSDEFRAAVKFYADAFASRSPVLNVYATLTMPQDAGGMLLKFTIPDLIPDGALPTIKKEAEDLGVKLKITMYGRDYLNFAEY